MKTTFKSMMIIGMMILGTATGFAKKNANVNNFNSHNNIVRKECMLKHNHTASCIVPMAAHAPKPVHHMDHKMMKHFMDGRHHFDRFGICRDCHHTTHEILHIEREMNIHNHHHAPVVPAHPKAHR